MYNRPLSQVYRLTRPTRLKPRQSTYTIDGGTQPPAQTIGNSAMNFTLPDTDSIRTQGSKLKEEVGGDDLNYPSGQTTLTYNSSTTTSTVENITYYMEG